MLKGIKKDIFNRKFYQKNELKRNVSKYIFFLILNNDCFSDLEKQKILFFFNRKKKSSSISKTKIVRHCVFNKRSRVSSRSFGVSRSLFRELLLQGVFPGYTKAVW
jgi:ribosomal protein S14